jgi:hypothetical protein
MFWQKTVEMLSFLVCGSFAFCCGSGTDVSFHVNVDSFWLIRNNFLHRFFMRYFYSTLWIDAGKASGSDPDPENEKDPSGRVCT